MPTHPIHPLRILIADDHPNTASMLARALGQFSMPVEVLTARGGAEALDLAAQNPVDVLITDFMMPGLNGLELIEKLQLAGREPGQIILITAYDSPGLAATARRLKVSEYLVKPVQPDKIRTIVANALTSLQAAKAQYVEMPAPSEFTILIADDRPDNVRLLTTRLENEGYRFLTAADGDETLERARTETPDLILLDVDMPKKDGFQVLSAMRRDAALSHIPVIVITAARTSARDIREGLGLGADDYITKPFDWRELAARVRSKLRVKHAEDALRRRNRELSLLPDIGQDLSARFDVDELTDVTLDRSVQALGASDGSLVIFDPAGKALHRFHTARDFAPWTEAEAHQRLVVEGVVPQVVATRAGVIIVDTQASSHWLAVPNDPARSAIAVPLVSRTGVLGVLTLTHAQPGHFVPDHLSLLQAIAGQAAIAIENAKFYAVERRRVAELAALNQVARALSLITHSVELFDQIPHLVRQALDYPVVSFWRVKDGVALRHGVSGSEPGLRPSVLTLAPSQVALTGEPLQLSGAVEERTIPRPDGGLPPTHCSVAVPLIWDAKVSGVLAIHSPHPHAFQDRDQVVLENLAAQIITALERLRLFESVEREEQRMKAVLHGAPDAILMLDLDGRLALVNPAAERLFTDVETRLGQPLPAAHGYDALITLLDKARHSNAPAGGEIAWPDGRTFAAMATPMPGAGQVAVLHDVSHFKDLEKAKNEFIAAASHDLKNPLTTILGYSDLLERIGPLLPQQVDFLARIRGAAKHMHELVLNLLELARLDMGVELKLERFDIRDLLHQVADEYQPQADRKHQRLILNTQAAVLLVNGDAMRLSQVVRNLVGNAIKYTPEGGNVTMGAEAGRDLVNVQVQDTGLGIAAADLPYIFDKFYRASSDANQDIEGNGLGLSIVKTIVEMHGGQVTAESTVGQGSRFTFSLPLTREPDTVIASPRDSDVIEAADTRHPLESANHRPVPAAVLGGANLSR